MSKSKTGASVFMLGFDVLAASFGHRLYCAVWSNKGQCPACGQWRQLASCVCAFPVQLEQVSDLWARVATTDLLSSSCPNFYFPRMWNRSGPWVTKVDLKQRYEQFVLEAGNV